MGGSCPKDRVIVGHRRLDRVNDPRRTVCFVGDLDDPWVVAIADALPATPETLRVPCPGDLPDGLLDTAEPPDVLVIHRAVLTTHDAAKLSRLRSGRMPNVRVVLCHGPHARYADLERWAELVDVAIPEATADQTIARKINPPGPLRVLPTSWPRPRFAVVGTNAALRSVVADSAESAGYPYIHARDWTDAPAHGPSVWDVPWLEPGWAEEIARRVRVGPVVALMGFADRGLVRQARSAGVSACLELPFELADFADALDRAAAPRRDAAETVPPRPAHRRRYPPAWAVAESGQET